MAVERDIIIKGAITALMIFLIITTTALWFEYHAQKERCDAMLTAYNATYSPTFCRSCQVCDIICK